MTPRNRVKLGMTLPIGVGALGDGKPVPWTTLREIAKRGEKLLEHAKRIWPRPQPTP